MNSSGTGCRIAIIIAAVLCLIGVAWGVVLLLTWLIAMCFGLEWNILYGTGIWLIMILVGMAFSGIKVKMER